MKFRFLLWSGVVLVLVGCSVFEETRIDYRSAKQGNRLEIPPDLAQLQRDQRTGGGVISANELQANAPSSVLSDGTKPQAAIAPNTLGQAQIMQQGNQRWLVTGQSPDTLWEPLKAFWQDNGFIIKREQREIGLIETDWAEDKGKLPTKSTFGKLFEGLMDTGLRDKFRTRLETVDGKTEITITHKGAEEVYSSGQKDRTTWQPRPTDAGLEVEFLRRLMVYLQQPSASAATSNPQAKVEPTTLARSSRVEMQNNTPTLIINDNFDRAWRRLGVALDRGHFIIKDKDRSKAQYLVTPTDMDDKRGFFSKLFSSSKPQIPENLTLQLKANGDTTEAIWITSKPLDEKVAHEMLSNLSDSLP